MTNISAGLHCVKVSTRFSNLNCDHNRVTKATMEMTSSHLRKRRDPRYQDIYMGISVNLSTVSDAPHTPIESPIIVHISPLQFSATKCHPEVQCRSCRPRYTKTKSNQ